MDTSIKEHQIVKPYDERRWEIVNEIAKHYQEAIKHKASRKLLAKAGVLEKYLTEAKR